MNDNIKDLEKLEKLVPKKATISGGGPKTIKKVQKAAKIKLPKPPKTKPNPPETPAKSAVSKEDRRTLRAHNFPIVVVEIPDKMDPSALARYCLEMEVEKEEKGKMVSAVTLLPDQEAAALKAQFMGMDEHRLATVLGMLNDSFVVFQLSKNISKFLKNFQKNWNNICIYIIKLKNISFNCIWDFKNTKEFGIKWV